MSTQRVSKTYRCPHDCKGYAGCPGHTLTLAFHGYSDTISMQIDEEPPSYFNEPQFHAMLEAWDELLKP